jgi:hypothetical protein
VGRTITRERNRSVWEFDSDRLPGEHIIVEARADYLPGGRQGDARVWLRVFDDRGRLLEQDHGSTDIRIHRDRTGKAYEAIVGDGRDRTILGAVEQWASVLLDNYVKHRAGRAQAERHGHPDWSHTMAYGPCTRRD